MDTETGGGARGADTGIAFRPVTDADNAGMASLVGRGGIDPSAGGTRGMPWMSFFFAGRVRGGVEPAEKVAA